MSVLVARGIEKSWGDRLILRGCDLDVLAGGRVALVGTNGSGKSTLLQIISGIAEADGGRVHLSGTIALLDQAPDLEGPTVADELDRAVGWHSDLVARYEAALSAGQLDEAATVQDRLDTVGWTITHKLDAVADRVGAPPRSAEVTTLSGGERRRVALVATLLRQPDLLVLDEPTNHLDADAVEWLQDYLQGYRGAVLLVTHDRYLLEAVADTIVEIDHGETVSYDGSYTDYLVARAERAARLERDNDRKLSMIRREAEWASRSPAARSTKQKARLQRLDQLRDSVDTRHERDLQLDFKVGVAKGRTLLEAHGVSKTYGERTLFRALDLVLRPGERVGIVGPNGAGKTTLLRVLLGTTEPDTGHLVRASRLTTGLLDQGRTGLDPELTVIEAAGGGNDQVKLGDDWVTVQSFLGRFAFDRAMFDQQVSKLSGGEQARLLLARLLLRGAELLVLDEPTNDLDLLTLRVLEEALLGFDGAAIIVTHDRAFLDRVCTSVLGFDGDGAVGVYADRQQYLRALDDRRRLQQHVAPAEAPPQPAKPQGRQRNRDRLTWKERQEFAGIPDRIETLEADQAALHDVLADPATYAERGDEVPALNERVNALTQEIEALYARWESLAERDE
ncbi:MAG: ATP-binding cassette subfamily F protein uup [Myxococcota bacterium]|jgi:ATP-binding cassette subfamily F protein uup